MIYLFISLEGNFNKVRMRQV